jgi:hypothetical protein
MEKYSGVCCKICKKWCRDNYDLNRHLLKKKPCVSIKPKNINIKSEVVINNSENVINNSEVIINETEDNESIIINTFKNEDISKIDPNDIVNNLNEIIRLHYDPYICAAKLIIYFNTLINLNENNHNLILSNNKSSTIDVYTNTGWKKQSTIEVVNEFIIFRSEQLLKFKEITDQLNTSLLKLQKIKNVWRNVVCFKKYGRDHSGVNDTTRRVKTMFKIALLN